MSLQNEDAIGVVSAARQMPRLLIVSWMFFVISWSESDLMQAFLRTLVHCDQPLPDSRSRCPEGSVNIHARCAPIPPHHPGWSGSYHCLDRAYVLGRGSAVGGQLKATDQVGQLLANVFISPAVDSTGRKPIMLVSLMGFAINGSLLLLSSTYHSAQLSVVFFAVLVASSTNCFQASSQAMAADFSLPKDRGIFFSVLSMAKSSGLFCAMVIGFLILNMELEDYSMVWTTFLIISMIFCGAGALLLRETLQSSISLTAQGECRECSAATGCSMRSPERHHYCYDAISKVMGGWHAVRQDPVLLNVVSITLFLQMPVFGVVVVGAAWSMAVLGYSQAVASLIGIVVPIGILVGYGVAASLTKWRGPFFTFRMSLGSLVLGYGIVSLGALLRPAASVLFWLGHAFTALGCGLSIPSRNAIMSMRVGSDLQGRVFAFSMIAENLGVLTGSLLWSNLFWTGATHGWQTALPWLASCLFCCAALLWFIDLHRRYRLSEENASTQRELQHVDVGGGSS